MGITFSEGDGRGLRLLPPATYGGDTGQVSHGSLRWLPATGWAGKRTPRRVTVPPAPVPAGSGLCISIRQNQVSPEGPLVWGGGHTTGDDPLLHSAPHGRTPASTQTTHNHLPAPWALQTPPHRESHRAPQLATLPRVPPAHPRLHPPRGLPAGVTLLRQGCLLPRYPSAQGCLSRQPPAGGRWHRYRAMSAPHWPAHRRPRWVGCWARPCSAVQGSGISRTLTTCCVDQCCLYMRDARRKEPDLCTCGVTTA